MGYFTADLVNADALGRGWAQWLAEGPEKKNGRKTNGRSVHEKNQWLSARRSVGAELIEVDGKKFDPKEIGAALKASERAGFRLEEEQVGENTRAKEPAQRTVRLTGRTEGGPRWKVGSIQTKRTKSRPYPPFITSTLQQAAANQLDFTAQHTMSVAQALYEGLPIEGLGSIGLITYMRTDSTNLSSEAIGMARGYIQAHFGERYLPEKANVFVTSAKSAQEAHEAIRPTDVDLTPERVRSSLKDSHYRLYKLIWERFVACQMTDAEWDSTTVLISGEDASGGLVFRATGRVLVFDGYHRVTGVPNALEEAILPELTEGQGLAALQIDPTQNFTLPPPRYTEASLVKKLESEGIGRPSTYAQIIQVIQSRKYVEKIRNRFHATDLGMVVTDKLVEAFPEIMQVGYTRDMEQQLDDIEEKHADWRRMLSQFYGPFKESLDAAYQGMSHAKAETEPAPYTCPQCGGGTVYRFGRKGRFLSCARYPECKFGAPIDREGRRVEPEQTDVACPKCGDPMLLRKGRFGPFLSCGRYPECDGIVNLDRKGTIAPPKVPALRTDLPCPQCGSPLNLRRGARGLWLSCSAFPKCRGRLGWAGLDGELKARWEKALVKHEREHPQPVIRTLDGSPIEGTYKPHLQGVEEKAPEEADPDRE